MVCGNDKVVSWWPSSERWRSKQMDFGVWTPSCEEWFQRRLKVISNIDDLTNSAQRQGLVRTSMEWRNALRQYNIKRNLMNTVEKASKDWIALSL